MTYRVRFHPAVAGDLHGIALSLLSHAGRASTTRILLTLRDTARSLAHTPHRGSLRDEILPGLRAIPAGRRGVIVFTVDDASREVHVHVIAYGGSDWVSRAPDRRFDRG